MKILNCPFCGAYAGFGPHQNITADWLDDTTAAVTCHKCYASGPYARDPENAIKKWNNWWHANGEDHERRDDL